MASNEVAKRFRYTKCRMIQDDSLCVLCFPLLPAHPSMSQPLCQTPGTEKKMIQGPFFWWAHQSPSNQHRPPTQNREIHHLGQKIKGQRAQETTDSHFLNYHIFWSSMKEYQSIILPPYLIALFARSIEDLTTFNVSVIIAQPRQWLQVSLAISVHDGKLPPPQITSIQTHLRISPQDEIGCRHLGVINGKTTHTTYQYSVQ